MRIQNFVLYIESKFKMKTMGFQGCRTNGTMANNETCRATPEIQDGGYETGRRIILRDINHLPVLCPPAWIYSFHLEFRFYLKYQGTCINFRFHVRHLEFQVLRDMKYSRTQLHWVDHPKNNIYCKIIVVFIISAKQYMRNSCSWCNFLLRLAILFAVTLWYLTFFWLDNFLPSQCRKPHEIMPTHSLDIEVKSPGVKKIYPRLANMWFH